MQEIPQINSGHNNNYLSINLHYTRNNSTFPLEFCYPLLNAMKSYHFYATMLSALLLSAAGCDKAGSKKVDPEVIPSDTRLTCSWPLSSSVDSVITAYTTEVVQAGDLFMLKSTGIKKTYTGYLGPCNLPAAAKKNGLAVKVSGYLVTFPGINERDLAADPFELTSVEYIIK